MLNAGFVRFLTTANWFSCSLYNLQLIGQTGQTNISFVRLIAVFCLFGRFFLLIWWLGCVVCFAPLKMKLLAFTWCCPTELHLQLTLSSECLLRTHLRPVNHAESKSTQTL